MLDKDNLQSKYGPWAIITGASEGIGKSFAEQLAAEQLNLILVARNQTKLDNLASSLREKHNIEVKVIVKDLTQVDDVMTVLKQTETYDIGLLIANAGFGTTGNFVNIPIEDELALLQLNCQTVMLMSHHFANKFVERGKGGMILLSSIVAFQAVARSVNYAASKAYVQSLAEGLQMELKPLGIDVLSVAPGPVKTAFAKRADMQLGSATTSDVVAKESIQALGKRGTVRPGTLAKVLSTGLSMLPPFGRRMIMSKVMADMTKHK